MTDTPTVDNTGLTEANRNDWFAFKNAAAYLDRHPRVVARYLKRTVNPLIPDFRLNDFVMIFTRQTLHDFAATMPQRTPKQEQYRQRQKAKSKSKVS